MRSLLLLFCCIIIIEAFGQYPEALFSIPASACLNENVNTQNQSTGAVHYEWDICQGDLKLSPTGSVRGTAAGSNIATGLDVVFDGLAWYAFVASRDNNSIIRVELGAGLNEFKSVVNLGNISSLISRPTDIKIVSDNGKWYGFVFNWDTNLICRLDFGTSLTNTPTATVLVSFPTAAPNQGLDIIRNGAEWFIAFTFNSSIGIVRLPTIESIPSASDKFFTANLSGNPSLGDIKILFSDNKYFAYTCSSNQLFKLAFGSDLLSQPTESDISASFPSSAASLNFFGLDAGVDENQVYLFLTTLQGSIIRINLGNDLSQAPPVGQDLGNLGIFFNTLKSRLVKHKSLWFNFSVDYTNGSLYRAAFPTTLCEVETGVLTEENPSIKFNSSGNKYITLSSFNGGMLDEQHQSISISTLSAPIINFNNEQICLQNPIEFTYTSNLPVASQNWKFGDGQLSTDVTPQITYLSSGTFNVELRVQASNGCTNETEKAIKIFDKPTSLFTLPTGLICTNNEFIFTNKTVDNYEGNLTSQWLVDDNPVATTRDLHYSFTNGGNKEVKLKVAIPGCSDETAQTINNIQVGPIVNFMRSGQCVNDVVLFTNSSSGSISSYLWNFGNGKSSTDADPTQVFPDKGIYPVSLQTTGTNGCVSATTKSIPIYSLPQPNFSLDLPPFSCSGTPSQFNDLTPSPTDSNLSSWAWSFGDAGTSTDRNPLHTFTNAGDYNVSLTATTNFGCSASFQKPVTITASPAADFTYTPACINQGTRFTDASGSGVKSWFWTIGGSTYAFSNPTHVFSGSGGFSAKLTVTGNNNCVASVTKTINVPVAPSLSFSVDNACEKQAANFKDTSPANTDPAASWSWDFAGQGTATGNAAQYAFASAGSYSVKMTSTQQSGCMYSLSKNVTINATPVAAFTSSPEWGVPPLAVQFTNTSTGANSYSWHFNDKNNSTSTLASPGFLFTDLGDYVVDLVATSALGCSGSTSGKISVIIPSLDLELKQLQLVKDPTSNVYRIFVTVKNKSNYLLTSVDVVVDISGNALIKETINTNLLPDAEIVQLLNNQILPHGNLLTYLCASIEVDNDNDPFNNSKCEPVEEEVVIFNPYPNPSNGAFRFEWIAPTTDNAHFEIFNAMGQLAFEQYAESVQVGLNQVQFDLSNLNTGAYYFRFSSNSVSKTLPIQIVR